MSRRSFLGNGARTVGVASVVAGAGGLLAACGSSTASSAATSSTAAAAAASAAASTTVAPAATTATTTAPTTTVALQSVSVQLEWIKNVQFGGDWMADHYGYYKEQGVQASFIAGGPNTTVQPLIAAGKADVGVTDGTTTAQARSKGAPLVIVATAYQKSPSGICSLAAKPIKSPQELIGKKIGMSIDSLSTYQAFMRANGVDPSKTTVVPVQTDPSPLAIGEVDALYVYVTNQAVTLQTRGIKVYTFVLSDFNFFQYDDVYIVTEQTLANPTKRAAIVAFLKAEQRGWQAAVQNPAMAAQLAVTVYGKDLGLDMNQQLLEAQAQAPLVLPAGLPTSSVLKLTETGVTASLATFNKAGAAATASLFDLSLL